MRQHPGNLATGGGLGAILLWSATFAFTRSLSEQVGPLTAGAAAYLIGGGFCLLRLAGSDKPITRLRALPRRYVLGCGSLFWFESKPSVAVFREGVGTSVVRLGVRDAPATH